MCENDHVRGYVLTLESYLTNLLILLCETPPCSLCIILTVPVGSKHSINRPGALWPPESLQGRQPSIVWHSGKLERGSSAAETCNLTLTHTCMNTHKHCWEVTFTLTALAALDRREAFAHILKILHDNLVCLAKSSQYYVCKICQQNKTKRVPYDQAIFLPVRSSLRIGV